MSNECLEPVFFSKRKVDIEHFSDASLKGWGGHCSTNKAGGHWSAFESMHHINWLELKAGWLALQAFVSSDNVDIAVRLDNTCAIYTYLHTFIELHALAKQIWLWCRAKNVHICASHIPGTDNTIADYESRHCRTNTEWTPSDVCFRTVVEQFDLPSVDLFASRLNYKVASYVSWHPNPGCSWVDAFTLEWDKFALCLLFRPSA